MTQKMQVYKCEICGNVVEVVHEAGGTLVCCGQPMKLMIESTADSAKEKHVPLIEKTEEGYKVTVGSTLHPMIETHYIEWIELIADGVIHRRYLKPGDAPIAEFCTKAKNVSSREYCNIHGLWKGKTS
ncbi:MAG: desulfoferrodoxin [Candidatus Marinimicrobia bacterium CG08_land_8_20_14_0_20_45_22]|nr:MAG: desulfoferrodoxin [Candidatus Marinimicrobia bacterium CG08_land_8_20_14_0_20_45_22]